MMYSLAIAGYWADDDCRENDDEVKYFADNISNVTRFQNSDLLDSLTLDR